MNDEYYKTKKSAAEYIQLAKDINSKQLIMKLEKFLPAKSHVLELGSGPGTDWQILNENYQVIGSDNSIYFLDHLKSKNPKGEFMNLDAITIETSMKFDGIYSNKVMHHLKDEELIQSIQSQLRILNTNGIICHSFWKGEGSEAFKGTYVNYHDQPNITKLYTDSFKIILIEEYTEFEKDDSLFLIGRKR